MNDGSWFDVIRLFVAWLTVGLLLVWLALALEAHTVGWLRVIVGLWITVGLLAVPIVLYLRHARRRATYFPVQASESGESETTHKLHRHHVAHIAWDIGFAVAMVLLLVSLSAFTLQFESGDVDDVPSGRWLAYALVGATAFLLLFILHVLHRATPCCSEQRNTRVSTRRWRAPWQRRLDVIIALALFLMIVQSVLIGVQLETQFAAAWSLVVIPLWLILALFSVLLLLCCACCCHPASAYDLGGPLLTARAKLVLFLLWASVLTWLVTIVWYDANRRDASRQGALAVAFFPTLVLFFLFLLVAWRRKKA